MTSMDFYPLDKHCPGILSPPVISSTSCVPESGSNDNNGYLNGGPYRSSTDACLPTGHSYCHGGNGRLDNVKMLNNNNGTSLSRAECHAVGDVDLFASSGFTSYYNLDSHGPLHHQAQTPLEHDLKKAHISFHHMQSSPVYTNVSCSMSVDNQSPMYAKDEFESPLYGLQCTPQSSTSPILPDSPPIVSSNSGNFHPNRHSLSPSHRSMCVAKKSSTNCYELKREMAESSGLNLNGAPYAKARAGRKGTANVASSTGSSGDSSQFTDADSNSGTPSSKQFVPCKVCGDKASGYHYGVTSCEGCKGFFRRSIQKQIEYRCLRDGKCLIIRLNRNRCQYCRFKKCLAVGMSRDSVRYGRVPKKNKEKERMEEKANGVTQAEADQSSVVDVDSKDLALYDTILTISQAHHANCSYTDDKVKGLSKKPIFVITKQVKLEPSDECSSSPDVGSVSESLEAQKIELWEQLALLITPCIQRVVEFAKRIPGFSDLTQDDQLILIKLGFFEVWLVHISKTADFVDNTLTFADGAFLSRKQLELMFDHEFMGNLFHLMSGLNSLTLNDTEIGLFSAIILLQSDRPQIYDIKAINKIQENVVEALKVQIGRNHSDDAQTFQKLMLKINELRALGSSHSLHLQWFRSNWLRLKLPPLFAEIFDIPKGNSFLNSVQPSSAVSQCMQVREQQTPGATSNPNNAQTLGQTSVANSNLGASPIENSNI